MIKKTTSIFKRTSLASVGGLMLSSPAFAQLQKVNDIMDNVATALTAASVITATVAILWAGYKVLFGGQTFREAAPILIGGLLIGGAAQIASMLVG